MDSFCRVVAVELMVAAVFFLAAVIGFRKKCMWVVAIALIAHGVFDYYHKMFITNSAVPDWWPGFCLAVDATLGVWLAGRFMDWASWQKRLS